LLLHLDARSEFLLSFLLFTDPGLLGLLQLLFLLLLVGDFCLQGLFRALAHALLLRQVAGHVGSRLVVSEGVLVRRLGPEPRS
jgi:hypothetical protein